MSFEYVLKMHHVVYVWKKVEPYDVFSWNFFLNRNEGILFFMLNDVNLVLIIDGYDVKFP